jgi:hypothetical protein
MIPIERSERFLFGTLLAYLHVSFFVYLVCLFSFLEKAIFGHNLRVSDRAGFSCPRETTRYRLPLNHASILPELAADARVGCGSTRIVGSATRTFASTARIFGRGTRATLTAARGPDVKTGHVHVTPKLQQFARRSVERRRFQCTTTVESGGGR